MSTLNRHGRIPIIVLGAYDRHNFGDMLFPHVVAALLEGANLFFAGLVKRDLRMYGGHQVDSVVRLAQRVRKHSVHIFHAGGELLTCNAWEAAVMVQQPAEAQRIIAQFYALPDAGMEWAYDYLKISSSIPYLASRELFPQSVEIIYNAVGGVELADPGSAMHSDLLDKLNQASAIAVRDHCTHNALRSAGIATELVPDCAVMVAELFSEKINLHASMGECAKICAAHPQGYIAVQFSADFGDDRTLSKIARQLEQVARESRCGVVLFRAGAAPWHDDADCYRRLVARMQGVCVDIVSSLNIWDICALIAHSHAYCGSSLHGRIIALAFARPRINMRSPATPHMVTKHDAFVNTWEHPDMPGAVDVDQICEALHNAIAMDRQQLQDRSARTVAQYREWIGRIKSRLMRPCI